MKNKEMPKEIWNIAYQEMIFNDRLEGLEDEFKEVAEKIFYKGFYKAMEFYKSELKLAEMVGISLEKKNLELEIEYFKKLLDTSSEDDKGHIISVLLLLSNIKTIFESEKD